MPYKITKEDGSEVEVLSEQEIQDKINAEKETVKKELEEKYQKDLQAKEEDHKRKLAEKTDQIKRFRDLTEKEKEVMSAKEIEDAKVRDAMMAETENTKKELEEMKKREVENYKYQALDSLGITGDEDRKKALLAYDRILGDMKTPEEIRSKMSEAINMLGLNSNKGYGGFRAGGTMGQPPTSYSGEGKTFADTPEGKELAGKLGMKFINDKK